MKRSYTGPLRHEPLAIELHNTLYAAGGELVDGLETADELSAWLAGIADRTPWPAGDGDALRRADYVALRSAVREALRAGLDDEPIATSALEVMNAIAARAPVSPLAVRSRDGQLRAHTRHHATDPTDVVLAAIAADAIELLTGPRRQDVRACRAPGCVLLFTLDHPRRSWCSPACGNRARQARHYERRRLARLGRAGAVPRTQSSSSS